MKKRTTFFCLALLFFTQSLWAQTYVFNGAGDWNDPSNWANGDYPGTDIDGPSVHIQGNCNLNESVTFYSGSLTVYGGKTLSVNENKQLEILGSFSIQFQGNFINNGTFVFGGNSFQNQGTYIENGVNSNFYENFNNLGTIIVSVGKTLDVDVVTNHGTITINGTLITSNLTIGERSTLTVATGGTANIYGPLLHNGELIVGSGATVNVYNSFTHNSNTAVSVSGILNTKETTNINSNKILTINSGGTYRHEGSTGNLNGTIINNGTFEITSNGAMSINASGTLTSTGVIDVGSGSTIQVSGTLTNNGLIKGNGSFIGNITNPAAGSIAPEARPVALRLTTILPTAAIC